MEFVRGKNKLFISSQGKKKQNKTCQRVLRLIRGEYWLPEHPPV